jgi:hypothetical protein
LWEGARGRGINRCRDVTVEIFERQTNGRVEIQKATANRKIYCNSSILRGNSSGFPLSPE